MKKQVFFMAGILFTLIFSVSHGMQSKPVSLKPIMSQQQLFTQKDTLESSVKDIWEECLNILSIKFPDLTKENENVLNVAYDFEQQPKTDKNILFIKNTVQNVINKTSIPLRFDKQTKTAQEQALKQMLEHIMSTALIELLLKESSEPLDWCTCIGEYKRITLALLVVNETREKYPNTNQPLVYTSVASGGLLQDYVILSELLESYTTILVNIIDLEYPDIPALAKEDLDPDNPNNLHVLEMKNQQEQAAIIDSFKIKMAQIISTKPSANYYFDVRIYQNTYEYIAHVKQNPNEKSNILIMVDPSVGASGMADFPSLANAINIWIDDEEGAVFTLYLPRHQGAQLYELYEDFLRSTVSYGKIQRIRNELLSLVSETGAQKNYTPKLVQALLKNGLLNTQATDTAIAQLGFYQLMQLKNKAAEEGFGAIDLLHPLTPITLGNIPVLLSWGTDPFISFQDLVWDALASNAIIYQLYAIDPTKGGEDENNKIIRVNPEVYKKLDVITPGAGKAAAHSLKRIF